MNMRARESGFSLVEVVIIVSIIGVLAAIAIPSIKKVMPKIRLGGATQTLANGIAMSRMSAIAKSNDYALTIYPGTGEYEFGRYVGGTPTPYGRTQVGASVKIASVKYKSDYTTAANLIRLYANGTTNVPMSKEAVFIQLQTADDTVKRRVVVHSTGRIFSERWLGGADNDPGSWKAE